MLPVADVHAIVAYYRDVLGFAVEYEMGDPPTHAWVTCCGVGVLFTLQSDARSQPPYAGWTYVFVTGVDQLFDEYVGRGVTVSQQLASNPHGIREFEIIDQGGHRLRFGQYSA